MHPAGQDRTVGEGIEKSVEKEHYVSTLDGEGNTEKGKSDEDGAAWSKELGKLGFDWFKDHGHRKHGWKNVYHKEEWGDSKKYHDIFHDRDWKKKWNKWDKEKERSETEKKLKTQEKKEDNRKKAAKSVKKQQKKKGKHAMESHLQSDDQHHSAKGGTEAGDEDESASLRHDSREKMPRDGARGADHANHQRLDGERKRSDSRQEGRVSHISRAPTSAASPSKSPGDRKQRRQQIRRENPGPKLPPKRVSRRKTQSDDRLDARDERRLWRDQAVGGRRKGGSNQASGRRRKHKSLERKDTRATAFHPNKKQDRRSDDGNPVKRTSHPRQRLSPHPASLSHDHVASTSLPSSLPPYHQPASLLFFPTTSFFR